MFINRKHHAHAVWKVAAGQPAQRPLLNVERANDGRVVAGIFLVGGLASRLDFLARRQQDSHPASVHSLLESMLPLLDPHSYYTPKDSETQYVMRRKLQECAGGVGPWRRAGFSE
jgi:hypothetical protein